MPEVDASDWPDDAVHEQVARLLAAGAQPAVTMVIKWKSTAERHRDAQDAADEQRCAVLRAQALRGAAASYGKRGHGH